MKEMTLEQDFKEETGIFPDTQGEQVIEAKRTAFAKAPRCETEYLPCYQKIVVWSSIQQYWPHLRAYW